MHSTISMNTITPYETDVFAWANEQAALIRARRFDLLDIDNIAEEILDVGKSEKREIASRMVVLLGHLLKWKYQPSKRSTSWQRTIKLQRRLIEDHLDEVPSLRPQLKDEKWKWRVYSDAVALALKETRLDSEVFPEVCPWNMNDVLEEGWLP